MVSTISGQLKAIDVATGQVAELGEGQKPSWAADGKSVFFTKRSALTGSKLIRADIVEAKLDGSDPAVLTADGAVQATAARVVRDGTQDQFRRSGR